MPARLKTFAELWRDGTFEARREDHIARLDAAVMDNAAPTDPELAPLLDRYERELNERKRYEVARQIERASRRPENKTGPVPLELMLLSVFGPGQEIGESLEAFHLRQIRHSVWQMNHGLWWRVQHNCLNQADRAKLADLALAEGDLDDADLAEYRTEHGWRRLHRIERQLLAPYTLDFPEPYPPDWSPHGEPAAELCECCAETMERFTTVGAVSEILAGWAAA
jgi:hypothetical protein